MICFRKFKDKMMWGGGYRREDSRGRDIHELLRYSRISYLKGVKEEELNIPSDE